jgi:hypothetical protein
MVIRLTTKLADKIKIKALPEYDEGSVIDEWYGHMFIADRTQYMIFSNAYSFFSVLFPGKGINDIKTFFETASHNLSETLKKDGYGNMVQILHR